VDTCLELVTYGTWTGGCSLYDSEDRSAIDAIQLPSVRTGASNQNRLSLIYRDNTGTAHV